MFITKGKFFKCFFKVNNENSKMTSSRSSGVFNVVFELTSDLFPVLLLLILKVYLFARIFKL